MLRKLEIELDTFSLQYEMSGLALFRDWILAKSGIDSKTGTNCRFLLDSDNEKYLALRVQYLTLDEINKLLKLLKTQVDLTNIDLKSQPVDIPLNDELIFKFLLTEFRKDIQSAYELNPNYFQSYQLYSRGKLKPNQIAQKQIQNFMKDVDQFLLPYNISTKNCDIFENTLVLMAGIQTIPCEAYFRPVKLDRIFIGVRFDADKCDGHELAKLMDFFILHDNTAYLEHKNILGRNGEDKHNSNYVTSALENIDNISRCRLGDGHKYIEYVFNLDGSAVAGKIMNEFKHYLTAKVKENSDYLKPYYEEAPLVDEYDFYSKPDADSYECYNFQRSNKLGYFTKDSLANNVTLEKSHANEDPASLSSHGLFSIISNHLKIGQQIRSFVTEKRTKSP